VNRPNRAKKNDGRPDMKNMVKKLSNVPEDELLLIEEVKVDIGEHDILGFLNSKHTVKRCGDPGF
jgi:hypothetical protein